MPSLALARFISRVGHPFVLMPAAVYASASLHRLAAPDERLAFGATLLVVLVLGLFSLAQVRAGRWRDLDASTPSARRELNGLALVLLWGVTGGLWALALPLPVLAGPALGGVLVMVALGLSPWQHMSLHAAFALYAAALVWPQPQAWASGVLLALTLLWSRWVLGRHTPVELATGALAGALAGGVFHLVLSRTVAG